MNWLHHARIAAVFAVVLLHVAAPLLGSSALGSTAWWVANGYDALTRWCVPVLVMVSGALLLDPARPQTLAAFYAKRVARIAVPLAVWSLLYLAWGSREVIASGAWPSWCELVRRLGSGLPYYHLWFLYMLLGLYLFAPFLRLLVSAASRTELHWLIVAGFALAALNAFMAWDYPHGFGLFCNWFLAYIPYFLLGHVIRSGGLEVPSTVLWAILLVSVGLTAWGCYAVTARSGLAAGLYFYNYLSITTIPMSVAAMLLLCSWERPLPGNTTPGLSRLTFGIYLLHPLLLDLLHLAGLDLASLPPLLALPLLAALAFGLSLLLAWSLSRVPCLRRTI